MNHSRWGAGQHLLRLLLLMIVGMLSACSVDRGTDATNPEKRAATREPNSREPAQYEHVPGVAKTPTVKGGTKPLDHQGETVSTDALTYTTADSAIVSWTNAVGSATDWVVLAPQGSPDSGYERWQYTGGTASGNVTFALNGLTPGSWVARLYANNDFTFQAESTPFSITTPGGGTATVTTNAVSYTTADTAQVSFANAAATQYDWVAIAPAGSPDNGYVAYQYTGATPSGTLNFPLAGFSNGNYVARLYANNDFTLQATSAVFSIGAGGGTAAVTTNQASYQASDTAIVSFSNALATQYDWIAIAPQGAPDGGYVLWQYTGATPNGSLNFALTGLSGTYVARLYANNDFTLQATSAPFTVGAAAGANVTTDQATYAPGSTATVSWTGAAAGPYDWISLTPAGSPQESYVQWQYTGGTPSGSLQFNLTGLANGDYVVRLYANNDFTLQASTTFTIGTPAAPSVTPDNTTYALGQPVIITFAGAAGNANDWVSIAAPGSPGTSYDRWAYTGGGTGGTITFNNMYPGTYVARLHFNDGTNIEATSVEFTVNP